MHRNPIRAMLVMLCVASAAAADDGAKDRQRLQGNWAAPATPFEDLNDVIARLGEKASANQDSVVVTVEPSLDWTFFRDRFVWSDSSRTHHVRFGSWTVNADANPKEIDLVGTARRGDEKKEITLRGIYELTGNNLTICFSAAGPRPKEFKQGDAGQVTPLVLDKDVPPEVKLERPPAPLSPDEWRRRYMNGIDAGMIFDGRKRNREMERLLSPRPAGFIESEQTLPVPLRSKP